MFFPPLVIKEKNDNQIKDNKSHFSDKDTKNYQNHP